MAKKKTIKKIDLKPKVKVDKKAEACSGCEILIVLGSIAALILGTMYFKGSFDNLLKGEIKVGDCMLDRMYRPLKVTAVYPNLGEVAFETAVIEKSHYQLGRAYLETNRFSYEMDRLDVVRRAYSKIPCDTRSY